MDQRRRRWMKGGRAETADRQDDAERDGRRSKTDEWQQRHGEERAGYEQRSRAPPVGDVAERELRY